MLDIDQLRYEYNASIRIVFLKLKKQINYCKFYKSNVISLFDEDGLCFKIVEESSHIYLYEPKFLKKYNNLVGNEESYRSFDEIIKNLNKYIKYISIKI